ncbi:uncharacterized protein LOC110704848 [Chenopodium quinoa]|uniref:uncharacterized protein LOC110704848 n=1 Tax=Chenopodium quinoa TaxID=63459 RepID=UPI000B787307|nr:uncharacterized protein LOC110704848 [Chenopodium quinoa]
MSKFIEKDWWDLFWCILWGIWLKRNAFLFEKRCVAVQDVFAKASGLVGDYAKALEVAAPRVDKVVPLNQVWTPPMLGAYKINTDAACFSDNSVGLGAVMRDWNGDVVVATCSVKMGSFDIVVAEALAARLGLSISLEAGLMPLILEVDFLQLFQKLKKGNSEKSLLGSIVGDILHMASLCSSLSFSHTGRNGNTVAHKLANLSREFNDVRVWYEVVPPCIALDVARDVP